MNAPIDFRGETLTRVQELIEELESQADQTTTALARELLQLILDLHGKGLARIMELAAETEDGVALLERLSIDEVTRGLLLLHGLHPKDMESRTAMAIDTLRPHLGVLGVRIDNFTIADGRLLIQLNCNVSPDSKQTSADTLQQQIYDVIFGMSPDLEHIDIAGLPVATTYIPLSDLVTRTAITGKTAMGQTEKQNARV